ncbi:4-alpha-glucanotransferase [Deminuibacter soli]|uniref:4-alpha-glucanotransferase n=2 Tax=Deminuibacter soli TaxID=2291815 RepID=A0A3E1NEZ3_9BACT|nr:4-alpha-glucanotransferase [Deminuibacter soli]
MQITLQLRFHTEYGQSLYVTGNHPLLGNNDPAQAVPMQYFDKEQWQAVLQLSEADLAGEPIRYRYLLKEKDGSTEYDFSNDKVLNLANTGNAALTVIYDFWNYGGYYENAFYTEPFQEVLLKPNETNIPVAQQEGFTHWFRIKAPLLAKGQAVCMLGNAFGNWQTAEPLVLGKNAGSDYWEIKLHLVNGPEALVYKYGIYDVAEKSFVGYEQGNNRVLYDIVAPGKQTIVNDGYIQLPANTWRGAGVAIPVFSLRSNASMGCGEFTDLNLLVDWAKKTGLKLVQILPINDTRATGAWTDSYPYAAISAFALHPIYLNIGQVAAKANQSLVTAVQAEATRLNQLPLMDYEAVLKLKLGLLKQLYELQGEKTFTTKAYQVFFNQNSHWLQPYAVFSYLRDTYGTPDYNQWPEYNVYKEAAIAPLLSSSSAAYNSIAFYYFIQYHLHTQLQAATAYAHASGIILKGDIAIGIFRNSVDAWQQPELYHMEMQAGAPPDDFAIKGQNWGFPTYNWERMKADGFNWWQRRFEQMSYYFDAFRIDHILGFFRIWSIPLHAVEGIMGRFVPALPVHIRELHEHGINFDYKRYTQPYITDAVLAEIFGNDAEGVKQQFLQSDGAGGYALKPAFTTQKQVAAWFAQQIPHEANDRIQQGVFDLISNVIFFEADPEQQGLTFHFRFNITATTSYKYLDPHARYWLNELYIDYFFRRQDAHWKTEAMQKLPLLKTVTNMLICGEDLGLVPRCVPSVMKDLGLLSLEVQRMPKDPAQSFARPNAAPYLSVVTPSTHDMSTIRGWWEEDAARTQQFYNQELYQWGQAPATCDAWINREIVQQHLSSPAMWSIFQLQDLMGSDEQIRVANPDDERINVPANPHHYWRYRMHLTLEQLLESDNFNNMLQQMIKAGGR